MELEEHQNFYIYNNSEGEYVNSTCPPLTNLEPIEMIFDIYRNKYPNLVTFNFIIETIVVGILCMIGFVGNLLSFLVLWKDRSQSTTNFLLQALAFSDTILLINCLLVMTLRSIYPYLGIMTEYMKSMPYMMLYLWPFAMTAQAITNWLVILVTIERYIVVCKPLRALHWCTKLKAKRGVIGVVVFAILYNIPRFFEFEVVEYLDLCSNTSYAVLNGSALQRHPVYDFGYRIISYSIFIAVGPVVILVVLNIKLIRALHKAQRERLLLTRSRSTKCQQSQAGNTTVIVAVVTQFIICQTPALVQQVLETSQLKPDNDATSYSVVVSNMLVAFNSSTNFFIYCLFGRKFRSIFINLLCPSKKKRAVRIGRHFDSINNHGHDMTMYTAEFTAVSQGENGDCV